MSQLQWHRFGKGGLTIEPLVNTMPPEPEARAKTTPKVASALLILAMLASCGSLTSIALEWFGPHDGTPSAAILRVQWLLIPALTCAVVAIILVGLAWAVSRLDRARLPVWSILIGGPIIFVSLGAAIFSGAHLFSVPPIPSIVRVDTTDSDDAIIHDMTAMIWVRDRQGSYRRATMGTGVLVGVSGSHGVVVADKSLLGGQTESGARGVVWVNFRNGCNVEGNARTLTEGPGLTVIDVQAENLPSPVALQSIVETVIPGDELLASGKPLHKPRGFCRGIVLRQRGKVGVFRIYTTLPPREVIPGSAVFDGTLGLVGITITSVENDDTTEVLGLTREFVSRLTGEASQTGSKPPARVPADSMP